MTDQIEPTELTTPEEKTAEALAKAESAIAALRVPAPVKPEELQALSDLLATVEKWELRDLSAVVEALMRNSAIDYEGLTIFSNAQAEAPESLVSRYWNQQRMFETLSALIRLRIRLTEMYPDDGAITVEQAGAELVAWYEVKTEEPDDAA